MATPVRWTPPASFITAKPGSRPTGNFEPAGIITLYAASYRVVVVARGGSLIQEHTAPHPCW